MNDSPAENTTPSSGETQDRRLFLQGMGKWSGAAILAVAGGSLLTAPNARGAAWINRRGGWINGGGAWINGGGGGGGSWVNRSGGGGGWVNRRGGGGAWVNRR